MSVCDKDTSTERFPSESLPSDLWLSYTCPTQHNARYRQRLDRSKEHLSPVAKAACDVNATRCLGGDAGREVRTTSLDDVDII